MSIIFMAQTHGLCNSAMNQNGVILCRFLIVYRGTENRGFIQIEIFLRQTLKQMQ